MTQKRQNVKTSKRRNGWSGCGLQTTAVLGILFFSLLSMLGGCAMWDPGGQVRRGLEQSKIYEWRDNGSFWVEGRGTQTEAFTMVQGELVMKEDADGEVVVDWENSTVAYYLSADPNADAAGNAMGQALSASTKQIEMLSKTVNDVISAVVPLIAPVPSPGPSPGAGGMSNGE